MASVTPSHSELPFVWAARPDITVRAFAVIRTISDPDNFFAIGDPVTGVISWRGEVCRRVP